MSFRTTSTAFLVMALIPGASGLAAPGTRIIEEIVVTARKREESLQEVPVVVQTFTAAEISRYAADDLTELAELATFVDATPIAFGGGQFVIRGQGTAPVGTDSSVGINVDGVQVARGHITRQAFFDLASMQVLKGPQVVYFGKNNPAGVIVLTGAMPTDEFELSVKGGYETEGEEIYAEAAISGPLTDTLRARLAYRGSDSDGWLKNTAAPFQHNGEIWPAEPWDFPGAGHNKAGGGKSHTARLTVDWRPNDVFSGVLRVLGSDIDLEHVQTGQSISCSLGNPAMRRTTLDANGNFAVGIGVDPSGDCEFDDRTSLGSPPREITTRVPGAFAEGGDPYSYYDGVLSSLELEWQLPRVTLTSLTGYYYYDWQRFDNFGLTTFGASFGVQFEEQRQFSQEVRARTTLDGPLNFTLGAFFETFERDSDANTKFFSVGPDPVTGFGHNTRSESTIESDTFAVFGEIAWDISDTVQMTVGGRFTDVDKTAEQGNVYVHAIAAPFFSPQGRIIESAFDDTNFTPEVTIKWAARDNITLYGAYREGYKSGGFSAVTVIAAADTADTLTFDPEDTQGFEVGVKSELMDNRLRLNADFFYYEYDDLQVTAFDTTNSRFYTINAAASETYGVEVESDWLLTDELAFKGALGYNKAEYKDFPGAQCYPGQTAEQGCIGGVQDRAGQRLEFAPEWVANLGLHYQKPIGSELVLDASYTAIFKGNYETGDIPNLDQNDSWRHNARIGIRSADDRWSISFIGRNLTDKLLRTGCNDKTGSVDATLDLSCTTRRGRYLFLEGSYRFRR